MKSNCCNENVNENNVCQECGEHCDEVNLLKENNILEEAVLVYKEMLKHTIKDLDNYKFKENNMKTQVKINEIGKVFYNERQLTNDEVLELITTAMNLLNKEDVDKLFVETERTYDDGKEYWFVTETGKLDSRIARGKNIDMIFFKVGNFFNTKEEAEMEALRIRGMRVKQTAKKGDDFYCWDFSTKKPTLSSKHYWERHAIDKKFATEKECQAWGDEFAMAF